MNFVICNFVHTIFSQFYFTNQESTFNLKNKRKEYRSFFCKIKLPKNYIDKVAQNIFLIEFILQFKSIYFLSILSKFGTPPDRANPMGTDKFAF